MAGLDEILNMIAEQQKETEAGILAAAESKVKAIREDAEAKASEAYEEHKKRAAERNKLDYENACSAADAAMKRKLLTFKVEQIDLAVEKTLAHLHDLPTDEYFELLEKLIIKHLGKGEGIVSLGERDLSRVPAELEKNISAAAAKMGGTVKLSSEAAAIADGFILSYGNISENCSFRAIIEAEKDSVRDTAAKVLFG